MPHEVTEALLAASLPLPSDIRPKMNRRERRVAAMQERRVKRARKHTGDAVRRHAFTIDEFCWAHGFSRASYYNLKKRGEGPDEIRVGGRVIITAESASRWRKRAAARAAI